MEKINLEQINDPSLIKNLTPGELEELVKEIRTFILEKVSKNGGHLSSNLGTVELKKISLFLMFPIKLILIKF